MGEAGFGDSFRHETGILLGLLSDTGVGDDLGEAKLAGSWLLRPGEPAWLPLREWLRA